MSEVLIARRTHEVAVLTLNRPQRRNALNVELCHDLLDAAHQAVKDGCTAMVITGEGTSFCSGADLNEVYGKTFTTALYQTLHGLSQLEIPVIAAVNGPAIGGGAQLALACDFRVVHDTARFAIPTAVNGLAVDAWTIRALVELAGQSTARRMLLSAESIDAPEAIATHLADRSGDLADALTWAAQLTQHVAASMSYAKRILNNWADETEISQRYHQIWADRTDT